MEKIESNFYAVQTTEDGNVEYNVKNRIESRFKSLGVLIPLKKSKSKIGSLSFLFYERALPNYVLLNTPKFDQELERKIRKIIGVEDILNCTHADGKRPCKMDSQEVTRFLKSTPTDQELQDFFKGNINIIFGQYAGYICTVLDVVNGEATIEINSRTIVKTKVPIWYLGKEEA